MKQINPTFEDIKPNIDTSFTSLKFRRNENLKAHVWHYHPEIELVLVGGGSGKRQIGSNVSYFKNGDLVLIGSDLPHCGLTNENTRNDYEIVIQMKPDFIGKSFWEGPEMTKITSLISTSKYGVVFGKKVRKLLEPKIIEMHESHSFSRLLKLLEILDTLANTEDFEILNAGKYFLQTRVEDNERLNLIFNFVKDHFKDVISLDEVANLATMTVPSFCRYFKKITNKTFTTFVNEYRITHSLKLLAEQPMSIRDICYESGFNNFSYFNKTFKKFMQKSPSQYRKEFSNFLQ